MRSPILIVIIILVVLAIAVGGYSYFQSTGVQRDVPENAVQEGELGEGPQ